MSTKAPDELREAIKAAIVKGTGLPLGSGMPVADAALAAIEAKYGPGCWETLKTVNSGRMVLMDRRELGFLKEQARGDEVD